MTTTQLRKKRDSLWYDFCHMPRRESFSGLHVSRELEHTQQELDKREKKRTKRYYPHVRIEVF